MGARRRCRRTRAVNKKTVRDVSWRARRALVRVDFNVPQDADGRITDASRIAAALPTLDYLLAQGASRITLMSHLGRPRPGEETRYTLRPAAERLAALLQRPVQLIADLDSPWPASSPAAERILLLENTRFHAGETRNDDALARRYSRFGDAFVNDAFGSLHRAHASTVGVAHCLPAVAGLLVAKELRYLSPLLSQPRAPTVALMGGAKISDKIAVIHRLLEQVDALLIGGGMANVFLQAQGHDMGASRVEKEALPDAQALLRQAGGKIHLPTDVHAARAVSASAERRMTPVAAVPPGWRALDIGEATIAHFANRLAGAATVFWNGPMGIVEVPPFDAGTTALAQCLAQCRAAVTIIGGGDSSAAVHKAGLAAAFTHVSTGGGATLAFLAGQELPGLAALADAGA